MDAQASFAGGYRCECPPRTEFDSCNFNLLSMVRGPVVSVGFRLLGPVPTPPPLPSTKGDAEAWPCCPADHRPVLFTQKRARNTSGF